ncbi:MULTISPECIES: hypothetical protein [unclassified Streptomyces]|uniref:hypothetical protein n=1 Tax=unclassified Streptomyces TaxID=2593676 RepID=UPI0035DDAF01
MKPQLTGEVAEDDRSNEWMLGLGLAITLITRVPVGLTEGSDWWDVSRDTPRPA